MVSSDSITRRGALKQILAGATAAGLGPVAYCGEPTTHGAFVERQPTGAEIWQVTTEEMSQSNIYCEVPYCSSDSRYFVYARTNPELKVNRTEFMSVELGTWKQHRLDTARSLSGCAISHDGLFYYIRQAEDGGTVLKRADLADGTTAEVYRFQDGLSIRSLGTVSTDRRYFAGGTMTELGWKMFDVALVAGGLVLASVIAAQTVVTEALALWCFFLVQSLHPIFGEGDLIAANDGPKPTPDEDDAFTAARDEILSAIG